MNTTPSYTAHILADGVRRFLTEIKAAKPWDPDGNAYDVALQEFKDLFGVFPSGCPLGLESSASELCEEAAKLACQEPSPTRLSHILVTFRKPDGSLVDDTTSYSIPGAYEAAEEDAHRYGWELVGFSISWK